MNSFDTPQIDDNSDAISEFEFFQNVPEDFDAGEFDRFSDEYSDDVDESPYCDYVDYDVDFYGEADCW